MVALGGYHIPCNTHMGDPSYSEYSFYRSTISTLSLARLVMAEKCPSTTRLVYYTPQEHLSHNPSVFLEPHSMIVVVCLAQLNFRKVRGI